MTRSSRRRAALLLPLGLLVALATAPAAAQSVLGAGEDATLPPAGTLRIGTSLDATRFDQRYGPVAPGQAPGTLAPLAAAYDTDTLGVRQFPMLSGLQSSLRALTGMPDLTLSLGALRVRSSVLVTTVPIVAEIGVTRRLMLRVMVPYVKTRTSVGVSMNPAGREGNVGLNPFFTPGSNAAARNTTLYNELQQAEAQLAAARDNCAANASYSPLCPSILANAPAILATSQATREAIATLYGITGSPSASLFVPAAGSAAQAAVDARIAALAAAYATYSSAQVTPPAASGPAPATVMGSNDLATLLATPAALSANGTVASFDPGIGALPLATVERGHVGDIEVGGKLLLFDGIGGRTAAEQLHPRGFGWRSAVAGLVRLPTAQRDSAEELMAYPTGDRQLDVEAHLANDFSFGSRLWLSVVGRYTWQMADRVTARIPEYPGQAFVPAFRQQTVDRKLGNYYEVEATPRYALSEYFAFFGQYLLRQKAADRYTGTFTITDSAATGVPSLTLDASALDAMTSYAEQRVGFGFAFSSRAAAARGRGKVPFDVSFVHLQTLTASGGFVPQRFEDRASIRFYVSLWGR